MEIEIDLNYIEKMARERADENWEFRTFLKQLDMASKKIDALVHQLNQAVSLQIDCTKCANCCSQISPIFEQDDISGFALGLKLSEAEFQETYLMIKKDNSAKRTFNRLPCPFLKDNRCSNYECRPTDCRSYPHLHKDGFVFRLWGALENYSICPIVFNVYEQLKAELWY